MRPAPRWQVLEEQVSGDTTNRYVWSPVYVDAMVLLDRDTDADGVPDERLWVQQDANWNVTAVVDGTGPVVERYAYDPFGAVTVYDDGYVVKSGGSDYGWIYMHQGGRYDGVSELYHFRNRDYSAILGRWTRLDPIRFEGGDVNLYGFVGESPTVYSDPLGLYKPSDLIRRRDEIRHSLTNPFFEFGNGAIGFVEVTTRFDVGFDFNWIEMKVTSTHPLPKDTHFLQFARVKHYDDKNNIVSGTYKMVRTDAEGKKVIVWVKNAVGSNDAWVVDAPLMPSDNLKPYYDTGSGDDNDRSSRRTSNSLSIVDNPRTVPSDKFSKEVMEFRTYIVSCGQVYYLIEWKKTFTANDQKFGGFDVKYEVTNAMPYRINITGALPGGYASEKDAENDKQFYYNNPLNK